MFLYVLFILLPATAMAVCNEEIIMMFFDSLDANYDDKITRAESDNYFNKFDVNKDKAVTLAEVKERVDVVDPKLKEHVDEVFDFIENDTDEIITSDDIDYLFQLIDEDKDGNKSRDEYKKFLKRNCQTYRPGVAHAKIGMQFPYIL